MEGNIIQLKEYHLNKGASKDHTPVFPMTKASAIEGMAELLKDLNISGVTPASNISEVNSPEKGKIYYEESTDKYYVYSEDKSSFVELGAGASVEPSDLMPTVTQTTSSEQSGGDNIITFTFPNGETTEIVIKNGAQGNSGYTGAANELEVVNNLKDGGATAALSAEMGKELAQQTLAGEGTFAKAYLRAIDTNVPFPWVLKDTDRNGNSITKIIWHIGNNKFIDAVGAEVNWYEDGITVVTTGPCAFHFSTAQNVSCIKNIIIPKAGITNIPFSDLKVKQTDTYGRILKGAFTTVTVEDGEIVPSVSSTTFDVPSENVATNVEYVDFGGLVSTRGIKFYSTAGSSAIKGIDRLDMQGTGSDWINWLSGCPYLERLNVSGDITLAASGIFSQFTGDIFYNASHNNMTHLDLRNFVAPLYNVGSMPNLTYLDVRGMNPSEISSLTLPVTIFASMINLETLVIGDFDTSTVVSMNNKSVFNDTPTNCTLVCTTTTPPATNENGYVLTELLTKVNRILVPPGCSSSYTSNNATVWKDYAAKISEYNEGDY